MQQFKLYRLHFTSGLHISNAREDYGISERLIHSDTLYAAIISALAKLGEKIPDDGDLGFATSSLFPFYQKDESSNPIYFFPKPLSQKTPRVLPEKAKIIKKVAWIDKPNFERILAGKSIIEDRDNPEKMIKGKFLTKEVETFDSDFICSRVSARVLVSRTLQEDAKPFYMDRIFFKGKSGFFFLAQGDCTKLEKGLNLLQYEGIGTDRNVGNGFFFYVKDEINIEIPEQNDHSMQLGLSLFIPESKQQLDEMICGNVAYNYQKRGGWVSTAPYIGIRKNSIYAFASGSVFSVEKDYKQIKGKIADLNPGKLFKDIPKIEHPIFRSGKGIFLPMKKEC